MTTKQALYGEEEKIVLHNFVDIRFVYIPTVIFPSTHRTYHKKLNIRKTK